MENNNKNKFYLGIIITFTLIVTFAISSIEDIMMADFEAKTEIVKSKKDIEMMKIMKSYQDLYNSIPACK